MSIFSAYAVRGRFNLLAEERTLQRSVLACLKPGGITPSEKWNQNLALSHLEVVEEHKETGDLDEHQPRGFQDRRTVVVHIFRRHRQEIPQQPCVQVDFGRGGVGSPNRPRTDCTGRRRQHDKYCTVVTHVVRVCTPTQNRRAYKESRQEGARRGAFRKALPGLLSSSADEAVHKIAIS